MISNYMLKETFKKLFAEAAEYRNKLTKDIPKDIDSSYVTGGGWHDNALYEGAIRDQQVVASKLIKISRLMENPVFIDDLDLPADIVTIGKQVELKEKKDKVTTSYKILGSADAQFNKNVISLLSPLGKALMGHRTGEVVSCTVNKKIKNYLIVKISNILKK